MKEMQLSFGISDDWLPGGCVAWNGLLCTSRSSLPILIPSHKSPFDCQARRVPLSLLAKCSKHRCDSLWGVTGSSTYKSQMASLFTHPHPLFNAHGPRSSITKATRSQSMSGSWHVTSLTGFRLLSSEKGKGGVQVRSPPPSPQGPPRSLAPGQSQHHTFFCCVSLFLLTSSRRTQRKHLEMRASGGTTCRW